MIRAHAQHQVMLILGFFENLLGLHWNKETEGLKANRLGSRGQVSLRPLLLVFHQCKYFLSMY